MRYLRSFMVDLVDALGVVPSGWSIEGQEADSTSVKTVGSRTILRNI